MAQSEHLSPAEVDARPDAELVAGLARGEKDSYTALVRRYSGFVYGNARAVGADHPMGEDVMQTVFLKLKDHADRITRPERVKAWLSITTRNTTRNELRKSNRALAVDLATTIDLRDSSAGPADLFGQRSEHAELGRCFRKLEQPCQEILWLRYGLEMSVSEMSEALDKPQGSIGPTQGRCLRQLSQCLESVG